MTDSDLEALVARIDGPRMMAHCAVFDRYTKFSGTPEELESLRYVEGEMVRAGFRTEILQHDAYISLPGKASAIVGGKAVKAISHSFSRSSPASGVTASLVDVGDGSAAAFAKADVRGKIVLVQGIANPGVSQRASRAGAIGQLHVSPHEHLHEMCVSPVWGSPGADDVANLPSTVILTIRAEDGAPVRAAVAAGPTTVTLHAEVDTGWRKTPILVCDLDGPDGADGPFVLFSGHHDAWYEGVMDNGGANATMIEVSRLCAERRGRWRRGLRVIYWSGHSHGRYSSSSWYADAHWGELERRAAVHVNVDSTGGKGNTVVADTTAAAELRNLAREAISVRGNQTFTNRRMGRAGDQSFWGIGVPSIFGNMSEQPAGGATNASAAVFGGGNRLGHGTGWWWHTPDDRLDKMDEPILVRDTAIYLHTVWRLLCDAVLPFDYEEHARYLADEIADIQAAAGKAFDLGPLTTAATAFGAAAARLNARRSASRTDTEADHLNGILRAVAHEIVPLDYSTGDRFGQDPALGQSAYPCLQPIRGFKGLAPDSEAAKFLTVTAMRARNRILHALASATRIIEDGLAIPAKS